MLLSEKIRLIAFLTLVGTVYVLSVAVLIRRFRRGRPTGREAWWARLVLTLGAAGLLCMAYGYWIEPKWLSVTHVRVTSSKMPKGARPIRIAYFGDLHSTRKPVLEERLPEVIAGEKPDLIVFAGDALSEAEGLPVFRRCMTRLAAIAPTITVKGNWDVNQWADLDLFGKTGVRDLAGEAIPLRVGATEPWIAGGSVGGDWTTPAVLNTIPPGALTIFIYHNSDEIEEVARRKVDVYLAAHTHGGQVALPFYGALITLSKFGKKYESGLYRVGQTWMYVNRGIGESGDVAPRIRFWARPELTIIELGPEP